MKDSSGILLDLLCCYAGPYTESLSIINWALHYDRNNRRYCFQIVIFYFKFKVR